MAFSSELIPNSQSSACPDIQGIPSQFQGFAFEFHEVFVNPFPQLVEITLRGEDTGEA